MEVKRRRRRRSSRSRKEYTTSGYVASRNRQKHSWQKKVRRFGMPLCILLFATFGMLNALRFTAASLEYYAVKNVIDAWQQQSGINSNEDYTRAKEYLQVARTLHPEHPLYMELQGQVAEWGFMSGRAKFEALEKAKLDYINATHARPMWPVTWANLAMTKWRLRQFDEQMLQFLQYADERGNHSAEVHLLFIRLGLSLYKGRHPYYEHVRDSLRRRLLVGLKNASTRPQILMDIYAFDAKKDVCRWLEPEDPTVAKRYLEC